MDERTTGAGTEHAAGTGRRRTREYSALMRERFGTVAALQREAYARPNPPPDPDPPRMNGDETWEGYRARWRTLMGEDDPDGTGNDRA